MAAKRSKDEHLTETEYFVLLALQSPTHGYGIIKTVSDATGGDLVLSAATLYTVLSRLLQQKLIESAEPKEGADPRRKPYKLTDIGTERLIGDVWRRCEMADYGVSVLSDMGFV